jgi:hypothetical protein
MRTWTGSPLGGARVIPPRPSRVIMFPMNALPITSSLRIRFLPRSYPAEEA